MRKGISLQQYTNIQAQLAAEATILKTAKIIPETWQRVTADWNDRLDQDKTLLVFGKLNKLRNKAKEFIEN